MKTEGGLWSGGFVTVMAAHILVLMLLVGVYHESTAGTSAVIFELVAVADEGIKTTMDGVETKSSKEVKVAQEVVEKVPEVKRGKFQKKTQTKMKSPEVSQVASQAKKGEGSLQNTLAEKTTQGTIGEGVQRDTQEVTLKTRYAPKPDYPLSAKEAGIEGMVRLRALVDENGRVLETQVVKTSGYAMLDESAQKALKKWRFKPAEKEGKRISQWCVLTINFQLKK